MKNFLLTAVIAFLLSCGQNEQKITPASSLTNYIFTEADAVFETMRDGFQNIPDEVKMKSYYQKLNI